MSMYVVGDDSYNQLGIEPTTDLCVDTFTKVPFDLNGVQCISGSDDHTVIIKQGKIFAAGNDKDFEIGSYSPRIYNEFTEITIGEEDISWASCSHGSTLYLTKKGKVILCKSRNNYERICIQIPKKAISVFSSTEYGCIIDEDGAVYIYEPYIPLKRYYFDSPVIDLACSKMILIALTLDGRVFFKRTSRIDAEFKEAISLRKKNIVKLSGNSVTCAALSYDGRVFFCGKNYNGQFGNGTSKNILQPFNEVRFDQFNEEIIDVSCGDHTLFLTESNKIYGCGTNCCFQLTNSICKGEAVLTPTLIATIEADQVIVCDGYSIILSGTGKLENPAKEYFKKPESNIGLLHAKIEELNKKNAIQSDMIKSLVDKCQVQSQSISQLQEVCNNLQQQVQKIDEVNNKLDIIIKSQNQ